LPCIEPEAAPRLFGFKAPRRQALRRWGGKSRLPGRRPAWRARSAFEGWPRQLQRCSAMCR